MSSIFSFPKKTEESPARGTKRKHEGEEDDNDG